MEAQIPGKKPRSRPRRRWLHQTKLDTETRWFKIDWSPGRLVRDISLGRQKWEGISTPIAWTMEFGMSGDVKEGLWTNVKSNLTETWCQIVQTYEIRLKKTMFTFINRKIGLLEAFNGMKKINTEREENYSEKKNNFFWNFTSDSSVI